MVIIDNSFNKSSTEVFGNSTASKDEGRLEEKAASALFDEEESTDEEAVVVVVSAIGLVDDEAVVAD